MQTDIFHLAVIPIDAIVPHEKYDQNRAKPLIAQIKKDGYLANPIIVTPTSDGRYIQLDGMNRYTAFKLLRYKTIIVQIIDYNDQDNVELSSWTHLSTMHTKDFIRRLQNNRSISIKEGNVEQIRHRYIKECGSTLICSIVSRKGLFGPGHSPQGAVFHFYSNDELSQKIDNLNTLVSIYEQDITRDVLPTQPNLGSLDQLFSEHPASNMMVVFPTFTRHQIIDLVRLGKLFPPGVTRHIIRRRCLNINLPLSFFEQKTPLAAQNEILDDMIGTRTFRLYEEPTIYFE